MPQRHIGMFFLTAAIVVGVAISLAAGRSAPPAQSAQTPPRVAGQPEKAVDRTTPAVAKMSATERRHAKLHSGKGPRNGKILDQRLTVTTFSQPSGTPTLIKARDMFQGRACTSNAVVMGVVTGAESFPTEDGSLLFTDYVITVTDVLRASQKNVRISNGQTITVTRIGGSMDVEGVLVRANVAGYEPLTVQESYLFFLQDVPGGDTFHAATPDSVWGISEARVRSRVGTQALDADLIKAGVEVAHVAEWVRGGSCR